MNIKHYKLIMFIIFVAFVISKDILASRLNTVNEYHKPFPNLAIVFDPARMEDSYSVHIAYQIYDTLFKPDEFLSIQPNLVASWQQSENAKKISINLKPNIIFHDGKTFSSDDVIFTIERFIKLDPTRYSELLLITGTNDFLANKKSHIVGLKKMSNLSIEILLDRPSTILPLILSTPNLSILPTNLSGKSEKVFFEHPVGTGPFMFASFKSGVFLRLKANKNYYAGTPYLEELIYQLATQQQAIEGFNKGLYHDLQWYTPDINDIKVSYNVMKFPLPITTLLIFNTTKQPFNNKKNRQYVISLVDKEKLYSECFKDNLKSNGIIPLGIGGYDYNANDISSQKNKNTEKPYNKRIEFRLMRLENHPCHDKFDAIIEKSFNSHTTVATVQYVTYQEFATKYRQFRDYDILEATLTSDYPEALSLLRYFKTAFSDNLSGFSSREYDYLLDKATTTADKSERYIFYRKAQDILKTEAVELDLYYNIRSIIHQKNVGGIQTPALMEEAIPMRLVYFEE